MHLGHPPLEDGTCKIESLGLRPARMARKAGAGLSPSAGRRPGHSLRSVRTHTFQSSECQSSSPLVLGRACALAGYKGVSGLGLSA
jgi:hypothetical protein